jgi:hypothetical protein
MRAASSIYPRLPARPVIPAQAGIQQQTAREADKTLMFPSYTEIIN